MAGDARGTRQSGEHRVPLDASANLQALSTAVQMGFQNINDRFDASRDHQDQHASQIARRLDEGAARMEKIEAGMTAATTQLNAIGPRLTSHSETIENLVKGRGIDRTPRATPALQPLKEKSAASKFMMPIYNAVITTVVVATVVWLLRGGAAPIVNSTNPPALPPVVGTHAP